MNKIVLPDNYEPSEKEEYMNPFQLEYFKQILIQWKDKILNESKDTLQYLKEEELNKPDVNDRASTEYEVASELRSRNRYFKLLSRIDNAISRIANGEYGYCESTGEEIGLSRLKARPIASLCIEAQKQHEKYEKTHFQKDDEDKF